MDSILWLAFLACLGFYMYLQVKAQRLRQEIDEQLLRRIKAEPTTQEKKDYEQYMEYGSPLELVDDKSYIHSPEKSVN